MMMKLDKNIIFVLLLFFLVLSQLYRLVVFEDFQCDITNDSCRTIQSNVIGSKNSTIFCKYSDLDSISYRESHSTRIPAMQYHMLEAITKNQEHKLISTKKYYDFQDYLNIIKFLNNKILKHESFSYRFWGLSNHYGEMY